MATLDDIVSVDIHLNTTGVGRANFGTIMVFGAAVAGHAAGTVATFQRASDISAAIQGDTRAVLLAAFAQSPRPRAIKVFFVEAGELTALTSNHLSAAIRADSGWYVAVIANQAQAQQAFARAIEAERRLLVIDSTDHDTPDVFKKLNLYRTAVIVGAEASGKTAAAWAAKCLGYPAGSETWALKQLAGVPAVSLTAQQEKTAIDGNGSIFGRMTESLNLTRGGKVAGGEWIDVIRFRDWLQDVMQTNLVATLINRPKLPYTDEGLAVIEASLIASLEEGVRAGGVIGWRDNGEGRMVKGYTVTVPRAADVPFNIKASRVAHVSFSAFLTGAIHAVEVTGSFSYEGAI